MPPPGLGSNFKGSGGLKGGGGGLKGLSQASSLQQRPKPATQNASSRASRTQAAQGLFSRATEAELEWRLGHLSARPQATNLHPAHLQAPRHDLPTVPLPAALHRLLDPRAEVQLPPVHSMAGKRLNNRELDKVLASLARSEALWRRALVLHQWLKDTGHRHDDRLCTTLIRLCSMHGEVDQALALYDWMRETPQRGGAGLTPTVFTFTAAMRAALTGGFCSAAFQIWEDACKAGCEPDCRMSTVYIEVCTRAGQPERALDMYRHMAAQGQGHKLAPSVHTYTAALRAAAADEAFCPQAMAIWSDLLCSGCQPTGHAFAAAISACGVGGRWQEANALFSDMLEAGVSADVVSCTALASALATGGQWERCQQLINWMHTVGVQPHVRTYTALTTAMGVAGQWDQALELLDAMQHDTSLRAEPNAFTYSALIKAMSEHGRLDLAEQLFAQLKGSSPASRSLSAAPTGSQDQTAPASPAALEQRQWASFGGDSIWSSMAGPFGAASWETSQPEESCAESNSAVHEARESQHSAGDAEDVLSLYSGLPAAMAEAVLASRTSWELSLADAAAIRQLAASLPDKLPGQASLDEDDLGDAQSTPETQHARSPSASSEASPLWRPAEQAQHAHSPSVGSDASTSSPSAARPQAGPPAARAEQPALAMTVSRPATAGRPAAVHHLASSTVVLGSMMAALERAQQWPEVLCLFSDAREEGVQPSLVMYNMALLALAKSGAFEAAEQLSAEVSERDGSSHNAMILAAGLAWRPFEAETHLQQCTATGFALHSSSYCALIAAYCGNGKWRAALHVRHRVAPRQLSVHIINALLVACQLGNRWHEAAGLQDALKAYSVEPNKVTKDLLAQCGEEQSTDLAEAAGLLHEIVLASAASRR